MNDETNTMTADRRREKDSHYFDVVLMDMGMLRDIFKVIEGAGNEDWTKVLANLNHSINVAKQAKKHVAEKLIEEE